MNKECHGAIIIIRLHLKMYAIGIAEKKARLSKTGPRARRIWRRKEKRHVICERRDCLPRLNDRAKTKAVVVAQIRLNCAFHEPSS